MSFFDNKEEVLDVQLTQFGKRLLSIGHFKPVFYAFFDDDILYDSSKAGVEEDQNTSQRRIIEETPKLKTQHITSGVFAHFQTLEELGLRESEPSDILDVDFGANGLDIDFDAAAGDIGLPELEPTRPRASESGLERYRGVHRVRRGYDYNVQEKILLYPLGSQEVANHQAPSYDTVSLDSPINFTGYQHFTSLGIIKNVPQFEVAPRIELIKNTMDQGVEAPPSEEEFYDLTSEEITFRDSTKIQIRRDDLVLDIQELNTDFKKDKFRLEVYEILEEADGRPDQLKKIVHPDEIRALFHIKTDKTISNLHDYKTQREKNYQDRSRN